MKNKNEQENKNNWKSLVQGFVADMLERIGDNVSKRIHLFITQLKRRTIGAILMLVGTVFFLASIAIIINTFLSSEFQWAGWSSVGLISILAGYIMSKE